MDDIIDTVNNNKYVKTLYKKPAKLTYRNEPHYISGKYGNAEKLNDIHQIDITYMSSDTYEGETFKYILVVVDCYSRKVDCEALKTMNMDEVIESLENIYRGDILSLPKRLECDNQFNNRQFKRWCADNEVVFRFGRPGYSNDQALAETAIQKITNILLKLQVINEIQTGERNTRFVDLLPELCEAINKRVKPMKELSPDPVCKGDSCNLLSVGDIVRLKLKKPIDILTNEVKMRRRTGDIIWSKKLYKIENVLIYPSKPAQYLINDGTNMPYVKERLQFIRRGGV